MLNINNKIMSKIFINLTGVEVGDEVVVAEDDDGEGVTFWILLLFESFAFADELDEDEDDVEEMDDDDDDDDEDEEDDDGDDVTFAKEAADRLA
jgi:hypothetical protein